MANGSISEFPSASPLEDDYETIISKPDDEVQYNCLMSDIKEYIQDSEVDTPPLLADGVTIELSTTVTGNEVAGSSVLVDGIKIINTTVCTETSMPYAIATDEGNFIGSIRIIDIVDGSFTVQSTNLTDTASFNWFILNTREG